MKTHTHTHTHTHLRDVVANRTTTHASVRRTAALPRLDILHVIAGELARLAVDRAHQELEFQVL